MTALLDILEDSLSDADLISMLIKRRRQVDSQTGLVTQTAILIKRILTTMNLL